MAFLEVAVLPLRAVQAIFSIIVLGLTAYGTLFPLSFSYRSSPVN